jgi:hypothetical protein
VGIFSTEGSSFGECACRISGLDALGKPSR